MAGVEVALDEEICSEALILSDIFQLNELEAVDLILAGEAQKIHFEGLNRGLIAVVCYYDAHRLLIATMRQMLKWDREDIPQRISKFLNSTFINEDVIKNLFRGFSKNYIIINITNFFFQFSEQLINFTVQSEFARLQSPDVNGLGGSKHQKLVPN